MLDPLLLQIISVGFALLFLTAAIHKINNKAEFLGILDAYQILPGRMLGVLANLIPAIEVLLGISWLLSGLLSLPIEAVSVLSAMLLTAYTMAIAINLIRGRSYIDCGCGFSSLTRSGSRAMSSSGIQQLSSGLLVRNVLLILAAMITVIPPVARELVLMDYLSLATALVALVLLYGSFNQLLANNNAIGAWRKPAIESAAAKGTTVEDSHA